jgi:hypothetical protein
MNSPRPSLLALPMLAASALLTACCVVPASQDGGYAYDDG